MYDKTEEKPDDRQLIEEQNDIVHVELLIAPRFEIHGPSVKLENMECA
jgi:hypothetical protein